MRVFSTAFFKPRFCSYLNQGGGKRGGRARPEETGTDTLVTQALVRRRFGIAGIIAINSLQPIRIKTSELRCLFAARCFHRDDRIVFNHVRPIDGAAVKISCDRVPDTDVHDLTVAYQMTLTGPVRHQVFESNPLNSAIADAHPALNFSAVDSAVFFFRCRIRMCSTSVQRIEAKPSGPKICSSPEGPDTKRTSHPILLPNEKSS
jgi:hypothetical protein